MQVALTPERKRQKVDDAEVESDDDKEDEKLMDEDNEEEPQPPWAKRQEERMLMNIQGMMQEIQNEMNGVKMEMEQIKLQAEVALSRAEEAMEKAEEVEEKVAELQKNILGIPTVQEMIDSAVTKMQKKLEEAGKVSVGRPMPSRSVEIGWGDERQEKASRTMVVGGFDQDTDQATVKEYIEKHITKEEKTEEIYAFKLGSVGFVRFEETRHMYEFMRRYGASSKPALNGKPIWVAASRSPEERRKGKHLAKHKKVLIEVGIAKPEDVRVDYRRGILMVKRVRIGEWKKESEREEGLVELNEDKLKLAGIQVGVEAIKKAVKELLQE